MTAVDSYACPKSFLEAEYSRRCARNAAYSLRAFARDLDMAPSRISEVLRGIKGLSAQSALHIAQKLSMNARETEYFCSLVEARHGRSALRRDTAAAKVAGVQASKKYRQVSLEMFQLVSQWHHFAIVELSKLKQFKPDPKWIAKALGITPVEARTAVERLERLGLVTRVKGQIKPVAAGNSFGDQAPSSAIRAYHRQLIEKAGVAVERQSSDERRLMSLMLAFDKARFKEAQTMIRDFVVAFDAEFQTDGAEDLYALTMQFYSLLERGIDEPSR